MKRLQWSALRGALVGLVAVLVGALGAASSVWAQASDRHHFDIPAGDLGKALTMLAQQAEREVVFPAEIARGKRSVVIKGDLTAKEALDKLLANTGLSYRLNATGPVVVEVSAGPLDGRGPSAAELGGTGSGRGTLASVQLEEVIVTAQKRNERLQDVPVPVTALSAQTLVDNNQLRLQDYYITVPGLSVVPVASTVQNISIRGVTTGSGTNPTVGITVDDVPYGSSTGFGGSGSLPDFDPGDLARVEVLRGPQGTLYGASSMGGLVKYVTVDPSMDGVSGRAEAGVNGVHNGAEVGYSVRGSVNVPVGDQLALRASAFLRVDPGYIDNIQTGRDGINRAKIAGGRLSALWKPSDNVSLKLSALFQDYKGDGTNDVDVPTPGYDLPPLGDLQQSYLAGAGGYDRKFQSYSATLKATLGSLELTAVSGYNVNSTKETLDLTYLLGSCALSGCGIPGFSGFGVAGAPISADTSTKKFTQEVRFSAPIGPHADWLAGVFYTHENSPGIQTYLAADAVTGAVVGSMGDYDAASTLSEYAAFADVTLHITNRFDVQVGGRESRIEQTASLLQDGPLVGGVTTVVQGKSTGNAFTYLVTPRFNVTPDVMLYARLASGYRAGGPNTVAGAPAGYGPDKTQNYELGVKGDFLEKKLAVDLSLYYIDWKNIQVLVADSTFATFNVNGNKAKSQGVELSVDARPLRGLTIGAWIAYDDATLTSDFPAASTIYGVSGDRLPYTSRFSGSVSVQQEFPLWGEVSAVIGATDTYLSDRLGVFASTFPSAPCSPCLRQDFPAYSRLDLRAGFKSGPWSANFFATNVTDKRAATEGGIGSFPPFAFNYIQPRTVGVNVVRSF